MGGRSVTDGHLDPSRLADAIEALDVDVLALQEVDDAQPRSQLRDLAAEAAAAMGAVAYLYQPTLIGTPGQSWRAVRDGQQPASGEPTYGIALLSRLPVSSWSVLRLRGARAYGPVVVPGRRRARVVPVRDEPRAVITAAIDRPAGRVLVAATHLSFIPGWNVAQARRAVTTLRREPAYRRLLLGDLNLPGRMAAIATGWHRLAEHRTWPAPQPRVQFDHLLADAPVPVASVHAPELAISDHRALAADLPDL